MHFAVNQQGKGVAGKQPHVLFRFMSHHTLKLVARTGLGALERHVFQEVRRATGRVGLEKKGIQARAKSDLCTLRPASPVVIGSFKAAASVNVHRNGRRLVRRL